MADDVLVNRTIKFKDETHFWTFKAYSEGSGNMFCADANLWVIYEDMKKSEAEYALSLTYGV